MSLFRARWVLPIDRPVLDGGWVEITDGVIRALGDGQAPAGEVIDLGDAAVLPGLINAHTHLELSWMSGRIPPAASMDVWIRGLMALRRNPSPHEDMQRVTAAMALGVALAQGTLAFGDISNTLVSAPVLADQAPGSVIFHELLGFAPHDAGARAEEGADRVEKAVETHASPEGLRRLRPGLAPHAPYSVTPELFAAIDRIAHARGLPSSVHVGESPEELEFLMTGGGPIAATLKTLGVWNDAWRAPGCGPVEYLDRLGLLRPGLLAVHATQLGRSELATLAARGCVLVSCPRSNRWVGAGDPPLDDFYASGAVVALGTDSLASVESLDMFAELAGARRVSRVADATLLESATRGGARALGLDETFGRIAPGLRGPLLAVAVPPDVTDVQEYLVSGRPEKRWWIGD